MDKGRMVQVLGPVIDVEFEGCNLPFIKDALEVPTSVGYGASFGGISALLSMLNSCASGVSVVNIDNGFGAGYLASMINQIGNEK